MHKNIKKIIVLIVGIIFIILGLIGLVLPFLQGIIFLAIGLILVSFCFPNLQLWINKHTERYPRLHSIVEKMQVRIKKLVGDV